jgi:hypothetical protein
VKKIPEHWLAVGLITFVTLLTYGVLIGQLGFYRDDWYQLLTAQSQGSAGLIALFQSDRPLVGYLYALGYQIIGFAPLGWHIYALIVRLIGNLAFLWLVRSLWPGRRDETTALALLFAVYPGFASQPNAGVFVSLLIANAAAVLSFAFTVAVVRSTGRALRVLFSVLALVLGLLYLGIFEAMIGLEAARFAIIWYLNWQSDPSDRRKTLRQSVLQFIPYLILAAGFLYWRLFIFQSTRHATNLGFLLNNFTALPIRSVLSIVVETIKDLFETTFFAWVVPFYQFTASGNYRDLAIAALMALIVVAGILCHLWLTHPADDQPAPANENLHRIWLGVLMVLVIFVPFNVAGRNVLFSQQWDRYALPGALGIVFVVGGMLFHTLHGLMRQAVLVALIAMSVMVHYFSAAWYRNFWEFERSIWWQMTWRAPALERGTMLFIPASGFAEGYEIYGPANVIYYPGEADVVIGADVLNAKTAAYILIGKDRSHYDRSTFVEDHYENALISVFPSPDSCLHMLDGRLVELPGLVDNTLLAAVADLSNIDRIRVDAPPPIVPAFLGEEPRHAWCYYYQKMGLARQQGNWEEVARLADEAIGKDLNPEDFSEWMPVLEAYATLGREKEARRLSTIIRSRDDTRFFLCREMQKEPAYPGPFNDELVEDLVCGVKE